MYINRDIEKKILEAANQFASITVYGARQVGKSTLLEKVFPSFSRVSLGDKELRAYALNDPKGFLSYYRPPVIIDEIQKAPELLGYIKMEIDKKKSEWLKANEHSRLLYVLAGSNQLDLKKAVAESLAGRTCIFHLSSFSYNEIQQRESFSLFRSFHRLASCERGFDEGRAQVTQRDIRGYLQRRDAGLHSEFLG